MKLLATVAGTPVILLNDGSFCFLGACEIDGDGSSGNSNGDSTFPSETSYKDKGRSLNAESECYIVLPPAVIKAVAPIVLGCHVEVLNTLTGLSTDAIVGDVSDDNPARQLGESSIATARAIGVPSSPTTGGTSDKVVFYRVYPGVPAPGYSLQKYGS